MNWNAVWPWVVGLAFAIVFGAGCVLFESGGDDCSGPHCGAERDTGLVRDADAGCDTCTEADTCEGGDGCSQTECTPENCDGCCRAGRCRSGDKDFACGTGGVTCVECLEGESCNADGECVNCLGCRNADGECVGGTSDRACGTGGESCEACGDGETCSDGACVAEGEQSCKESCSGCCVDGECESGNTSDACGVEGEECTACAGSYKCESGACRLDPNSSWQVVGREATIVESSVNVDSFSDPDPFLEVTVAGTSAKTSAKGDTHTPEWNEVTVDGASAADIKSDTSYVLYDSDVRDRKEEIVSDCKPEFTDPDFEKESVYHTCVGGNESSGARAEIEFELVPK